jgi:hypothetical protein
MATLTPQTSNRTGITPTYNSCAAGGDAIPNNGKVLLHFKNTNAAARVVTFATQATVDGQAVADPTLTVPLTSGDKMIGPFPPSIYNDANGLLQLTYDAVTNLSVAVIRIA